MAVFTDISTEELTTFMGGYNLGKVINYKGIITGVENTNYFIETTTGHYILTLFEGRASIEDLPYFMGLMQHLAAEGFNCPKPIPNKNGVVLQQLKEKAATVTSFLKGAEPTTISPSHLVTLGTRLAEMHMALSGFKATRPNDQSLKTWQSMAEDLTPRLDEISPEAAKRVTAEVKYLSKVWPTCSSSEYASDDLPMGTIHADLFPDNVFFESDELTGFIDFYFSCTDFLIYDLAVVINAWCFDSDHQFLPNFAASLITGYEKVRPLTDAEVTALPIMYRGAALRFLLTRAQDKFNADSKPDNYIIKEPLDYVARLQFFQEWKQGQRPLDE